MNAYTIDQELDSKLKNSEALVSRRNDTSDNFPQSPASASPQPHDLHSTPLNNSLTVMVSTRVAVHSADHAIGYQLQCNLSVTSLCMHVHLCDCCVFLSQYSAAFITLSTVHLYMKLTHVLLSVQCCLHTLTKQLQTY
jgi:hypothetical protein